jgi:hypothetical protein
VSDVLRCGWCNRLFRARKAVAERNGFVKPSCRRAFHSAAWTWVLDAIENRALSVADIKGGLARRRATPAPRE